jgi:hypothetical protein
MSEPSERAARQGRHRWCVKQLVAWEIRSPCQIGSGGQAPKTASILLLSVCALNGFTM